MKEILAFVPFLILFTILGFTRIQSYIATSAAMFVTGVMALFLWKTSADIICFSALEGVITALIPIIWVIFAAVFTYFVSVETGAMDEIKNFLIRICPDLRIQAVLIAFCFGGFLESIAGFGTAVAIPTAMLISLGFEPVAAAIVCLVANSVPVAFGALGIPVIVLSSLTGLDQGLLTNHVAIQLTLFAFLVPLAIVLLAGKGNKPEFRVCMDSLLIGMAFSAIQLFVAFIAGPELVAIAASLGSLVFYIIIQHFRNPKAESILSKNIFMALVPFIILLALVIITRLFDIPFLKRFPFLITLELKGHPVRIDYLTTPGTILLFSAIVGGFMQGITLNKISGLLLKTFLKIKLSCITIISILILAKIMGASGMITSVAKMIASISGVFFPLIAPILGAMGTFVTGSDTSSNILLGELQKQTAISTGFDPSWVAASNTAGATAGKMISPQSISVAAATVGIESRQNEIFRKTFLYCLIYVTVLGIMVYFGALIIKNN